MEKPVVLSAVGDINLGDRAIMVGLGVHSQIVQVPNYDPFGGVTEILSHSNLTFGNLECVLSDDGLDDTHIDSRMMRATPKSIQHIKKGGFNLLSVANNHIMQHGKRCFQDTVQTILQEGILPIGVAGTDKRCLPRFVISKGLKFGFLGFSLRPEKYTTPPLYAHSDLLEIFDQIHKVRQECRFLIVSLHWGDEYIDHPAAWQIEAARGMIDRGASVVLGHHPHVLQGVERYNKGVIAYSLGNFVFDVWQKRLRESMVLQISFSENGIKDVSRVPVYISSDFSPQRVFSHKERNMFKKFDLLDDKLKNYPFNLAFSNKSYKKKVRTAERINQIQNRLLFLWQLPRYQREVSLQCLLNFVRLRKNK